MRREREGDDLSVMDWLLTSEIEDCAGLQEDCSREPKHVSERSIGYFETRVDWLTLKSDNTR